MPSILKLTAELFDMGIEKTKTYRELLASTITQIWEKTHRATIPLYDANNSIDDSLADEITDNAIDRVYYLTIKKDVASSVLHMLK